MLRIARTHIIKGLGLALALSLLFTGSAAAQETVRYFDETAHSVSGAFLEFFEAHGGIAIFGFPITEPFVTAEGRRVQYFQRARFEWDAEAQAVRLGDIGLELRAPDPPAPRFALGSAERYFPETGHAIGWGFRAFYESNGDEAVFGRPITGIITEDGVLVQYFERARFEWRHAESPDRPVRLTMLGTAAFLRSGLDRRLLLPVGAPGGQLRQVTALAGRASVAYPVLPQGTPQTVFFHLVDQVGEPLAGASIQLSVHNRDRTLFDDAIAPTDAGGLARVTFEVIDVLPGEMVVVRFAAQYGDKGVLAETSFRVWW